MRQLDSSLIQMVMQQESQTESILSTWLVSAAELRLPIKHWLLEKCRGRLVITVVIFFLVAAVKMTQTQGQDRYEPNGHRLLEDVNSYVEFGNHRTATDPDLRTGRWLTDRLLQSGFNVRRQTWTFNRFDLKRCQVEVGDQIFPSFPFWFPATTADGGLGAPMAHYVAADRTGLRGRIAYFDSEFLQTYFEENDWRPRSAQDLIVAAAQSGAVGAVLVIPQLGGEIFAFNATDPHTEVPLPIPSVIVAMKDQSVIQGAWQRGDPLKLVVEGKTETDSEAFNVVGTLRRGDKWIIISTPYSGWFQCGGERGAGLAIWLALAQWAARTQTQASFIFVANSGHELNYKGANHLHKSGLLPKPEATACWLHLGASIGNRIWQQTDHGFAPTERMNDEHLVGSDDLVALLKKEFSGVLEFQPRGGESRGELTAILQSGYRGFGFYGSHQWFHTPRDHADSTGAESLEAITRACIKVLEEIDGTIRSP